MPRWRKKSGSLKLRGRAGVSIVKGGLNGVLTKGDEVEATKEALGTFADTFDQLTPDDPPPVPKVGLKIVPRGKGWYDVVNETTGRAVNDTALRIEAAQLMAKAGEYIETVEVTDISHTGTDDEDAPGRPGGDAVAGEHDDAEEHETTATEAGAETRDDD